LSEELRIYTFGGPSIQLNSKPVDGFVSRKAEALLIYLVCNAHFQPRDVLAPLLWEEFSQERASANLRVVLSNLRKLLPSFLTVSRRSVGLQQIDNIWLDLRLLESCSGLIQGDPYKLSMETINSFEELVDHYQGEFLEGFQIRGSYAYESWVRTERERARNLFLGCLSNMIDFDLAHRRYGRGISLARQYLVYENLNEEIHRKLIFMLANNGQQRAAIDQYNLCHNIMQDELGIRPSARTRSLYKEILDGPRSTHTPFQDRYKFPGIHFKQVPLSRKDVPNFVGRREELQLLENYLQNALMKKGQIAFITGDSGSGKTALLSEFTRRSLKAYPKLIVSAGNCDVYAGNSDPYLPFRQILRMFSLDLTSAHWAELYSQGSIQRLWANIRNVAKILIERSPDLINTFLDEEVLLSRIKEATPDQKDWILSLSRLVERNDSLSGKHTQSQIFEQYTMFLDTLSQETPLLLLLDNLQWADTNSISLLFHLSKRLKNSPILILGAYRSVEIKLEQQNFPHPLQQITSELTKEFGEIVLDLSHVNQIYGQDWINAFLDTEPNSFSNTFRQKLFEHTSGNPLFASELLKVMRERGDIQRDDEGYWYEGKQTDWMNIPDRIQAVIGNRLSRCSPELFEILEVASVEGKLFTLQILSDILNIGEKELYHVLSREHVERHNLIKLQREVIIENRYISQYQFNHHLIQQYLYQNLNPGERRIYHAKIGFAMEKLFAEYTDEMDVQLAYHFSQAAENMKAVDYLLKAGDQARERYAFIQAIELYLQALSHLQDSDHMDLISRIWMRLGLTYHLNFDYKNCKEAYRQGFLFRQRSENIYRLKPKQPIDQHISHDFIEPYTLHPCSARDAHSRYIINMLFSGLITSSKGNQISPSVAKRWEILEEGSRYVFHLDENTNWTDGVQVTARDFEFAWKTCLQFSNHMDPPQFLLQIKGTRDYLSGASKDPERIGIEALNDHTLLVDLEMPTMSFPFQLISYTAALPLPKHAHEIHGDAWAEPKNIVTNGPFMIETWKPGESMILVRNPTYKGQQIGNVHTVEFIFNQSTEERIKLFEQDMIDIVPWRGHPIVTREQFHQRFAQDFFSFIEPGTGFLTLNVHHPPLDDQRVRKALAMTLDRDRLVYEINRGFNIPAHGGFIPEGIMGHSEGINYTFNPEQAKRLLAEAGYPQGRGLTQLHALIWDEPMMRSTCTFGAELWNALLGVKVEWDFVSWDQYLQEIGKDKYDITYQIRDFYPNPEVILDHRGTFFYSNWDNQEFKNTIKIARIVKDPTERIRLFQKADKLLIQDAAIIPIVYTTAQYWIKPWVKNFPGPLKDVVIEGRPELS